MFPTWPFTPRVFERLIAASRRPCNLGFLMYVADAVGYLGYAVVIVLKTVLGPSVTSAPVLSRDPVDRGRDVHLCTAPGDPL